MAGDDAAADATVAAVGNDEADGSGDDGTYCRLCGDPITRGAIASEQRACCLNATPIAGVCPTHGPVGPHHAVGSPSESDGDGDGGDADDRCP